MDDPTIHSASHILLHNVQSVLCGLPAVDHKRHFFFPCNLHLRTKHFLLKLMLCFFLVPVIIKPNLSDSHCLRKLTKLSDLIKSLLCHLVCIIRMNSKCSVNKRILLHKKLCVLQTFY